jgi:KDO2-lipid IV(A) lauroyltransferase
MTPPADPAAPRRPLRTALLDDLQRFLSARVERLPWNDAQRLGGALGGLAWGLAGRDRRRALDHLAIAFPDLPGADRAALARRSFVHFGTMLGESLWLAGHDTSDVHRLVELGGWSEIEAARAEGRPVLILTGHCGNWELLAAALNVRGLGMSVVARGLHEPGLQETLLALRSRFGTRTIVRGTPGAARELLRAMRGGGALGMLIDQDTDVEGVWVNFFGRPAWTPVGAAELALRFRAVVLPTFIQRRPDGSHTARIEPRLELAADPVAATQQMTDRIERQIRRVPEQWVWMHRRWRRRPQPAA